jgi:hypothetical protein
MNPMILQPNWNLPVEKGTSRLAWARRELEGTDDGKKCRVNLHKFPHPVRELNVRRKS